MIDVHDTVAGGCPTEGGRIERCGDVDEEVQRGPDERRTNSGERTT
jgi:hypothetical protein